MSEAKLVTDGALSDSMVTLGDVQFDPVATQDFRLSIEGTSGTGKSNSMAVILEDLAGVGVPTLIVERLGALSTVRLEDEAIVVVGARKEEGIDLAVGLEDLDQLGSWVLDRGMKILLDVSTYADYEEEGSRIHEAAGRAIRSLNDRAHEKYRSGDRTKSLLIVDEAHYMAPKDSAPEPELDEHVKRARGAIIKACTEGGNKGISTIVGYQRRAFLHNGVIQLAQDFIAHRPGDEDIGRTADALRCSEDDLAGLSTGEILARGASITDGDLVGPTKVRKRESPDPREESFDLPETPDELSEVLEEIQQSVEAEREKRDKRADELERLREENERLREEKEELEQELKDVDRLGSALEKLGGGNGGAARDVGEGVSDLQERVDELRAERERLQQMLADHNEEIEDLEAERDEAKQRVADLEADIQELRTAQTTAVDAVHDLAGALEVDLDIDDAYEAATESTDPNAAAPQDAIMESFQEDAIARIMDRIGDLDERERKLLLYIESRGRTLSSQKEWAQKALGLRGNPSTTHYDAMKTLFATGFAKKNNDGSVKPRIREAVADELEAYDVDEGTIEETYQQVLLGLSGE